MELTTQISKLNQEVANLSETLRTIAGKRFSSSSEASAYCQVDGQLELDFFNEVEFVSSNEILDELIAEESSKTSVKARKPRGTREDLFQNVPIKKEVIHLSEIEQVCEWCEGTMTYLGEEFVREEIRITPAIVRRVQIYREVFVCPDCKEDDVFITKKASVVAPLFKHSLASASIVSQIMYDKYVNALPLNRQEKDFARLGITLSRSVQVN